MIACRRHSKRVVQSRSFFRSFEFEGEIGMGFHKPPKKYGAALGRAKFKLNAGWLVLLAVCIIIISGLTIWNALHLQSAINRRTEAYVSDVSDQLCTDIDYRLSKVTKDLEMLGDSVGQPGLSDNEELLKSFLSRKAEILGFTSLIVLNSQGDVYETNPTGADLLALPGVQDSLAGKNGVSFLNEQSILYSIPLSTENYEEYSVLAGVRDKGNMQELIQAKSFGGSGLSCLIDLEGDMIISPTNSEPFLRLDDIFMKKSDDRVISHIYQMQQDMQAHQGGVFTFTAADGTELVLSYRPLMSFDWVLLTLVPANLISYDTDKYILQTYMIISGTVVFFALILAFLSRIYRNHYKELEYSAFIDHLTGGMNNAAFQLKCQEVFAQSPPGTYAVALLNIKNFKLINESFGSDEGNRTLEFIMRALESFSGPGEFAARAEADNYFFCMKENDPDTIRGRLRTIAETINDRIKIFDSEHETPFKLILRQGVYVVDDPSLEITIIQDRARTACWNRAAQEDNPCVFYNTEFTESMKREQELNDLFEDSLRKGEFQVYFQPKVWGKNGEIGGAEALVRWLHPQRGMISPGDFIPVLEKSGRICQLDFYVFEQTCKFLHGRLESGKRAFPVSVNLSRRHFKDPDALAKLQKIAEDNGVPTDLLELELTESIFFNDRGIEYVKKQIQEMHRIGFRCSLDDFGAGYSSLGLLMEFDVDVVKLDRRFFLDVGRKKARDVVTAITELAQKIGAKTVAEGIETQEQLDFVKEARCDMIQGYIYARPMPVSEFERWIDQRQSPGNTN